MNRTVKTGEEARKALQKGANILADTVISTLGAKGRFVVYEDQFSRAVATKDGVTVAKQVFLSEPNENMGVQILRGAALKTNDEAGDGTTTSLVLAQAVMNSGLQYVSDGANPIDLKRGIDKAVSQVVGGLKAISRTIPKKDNRVLSEIALVSANFDKEIGDNLTEAFKEVSREGLISIEHGDALETMVKTTKGMQLKAGWKHPGFINNPAKMQCVLSDVLILVTDEKLSKIDNLIPVLEAVNRTGKTLLIISDDIEGAALSTLVANARPNKDNVVVMKSCAITAPGVGNMKDEYYQDVAAMTGATFMTEHLGRKLETTTVENLGSAKRVIIGSKETVIIGGGGSKESLKNRVSIIGSQIKESTHGMEKQILKERKANLTNGAAIIEVGGKTPFEISEKADRYVDAYSATKAAIEEGYVPGGGIAYIRCIDSLKGLKGLNSDEDDGINIVRMALEAPLRRIVQNAGKHSNRILAKVLDNYDYSTWDKMLILACLKKRATDSRTVDFGFNVKTDKYEALYDTGVIDPTKVSRLALQNAASVAGMMLVTEALIVNEI